MTKAQERKRNGQYGVSMDAVCECGHTLGQHTAERPYECIAHELGATDEVCPCSEFEPLGCWSLSYTSS
jgi:hypothetical protein